MNIKKFINIINPQPVLGGLEISDLALRFIKLKGDNLISAFVNLPQGVIKDGKIKKRADFLSALLNLHSQITGKKKKKIYVIAGIPNINVYLKVFSLPLTASANFKEAAKLNLQMISPIEFSETYNDWQPVGENKIDGGQIEILGALASRKIIEGYGNSLEEAGFVVAAVEYPALSLVRLAVEFGAGVNVKNPYLLFQVSGDGLNFSIIRNGNLYFAHFYPWKTAVQEEGKISFSSFKELVIRETQKVLNFYGTHWEGQINKVILVSSGFNKEVAKILSEDLSLNTQSLVLKKFSNLSPDWYGALSSALRGAIPRSQDTIISLASVGTEEKFQRYRIINFAYIWRNIVFALLIFMIAVFGAAEGFLIKTMKSVNVSSVVSVGKSEIAELKALREEAGDFNKKVELALKAKRAVIDWPLILVKIKNSVSNGVVFERIFIQSLKDPVLINATAINQEAAINFKNVLIQEPRFYEVDLPLSNIISSTDGPVKFRVSFKIKGFEQ